MSETIDNLTETEVVIQPSAEFEIDKYLYLDQVQQTEQVQSNSHISWAKKTASGLLLAGSLIALGFQQSPANEAVRTAITLEAFDNTDNKLAAAGASGAVTMLIEGGTSSLIALGITREKSAVNRFVERYRRKKSAKMALDESLSETDAVEQKEEISKPRKVLRGLGNTTLALSMGPGILVVKKHITGENTTIKEALKTGLGYSAIGAIVSAGVFGYGVTEGVQSAEDAASGTPVEFLVDYATDAKTWAAGIAITGVAYGISRIRNSRNSQKAQIPQASLDEGIV